MCFAGACDAVCEDSDVEAIEEVFDRRGDFMVKDLLLCSILVVHAVELEAERLHVVLWIRYPHNGRTTRALTANRLCSDDGIFVKLKLEQGSDAGNNADTHGCGRGSEGLGI